MSREPGTGGQEIPLLDTVVVGAGAVGLVAALTLRAEGLPVLVVESEPEDRVRPGSRATYLFQESLDLIDEACPALGKEIGEAGRRWDALRTTYAGRTVYYHRFPAASRGFGASVSQRSQERYLMAAAVRAGVRFRWASPVTGVRTDEHAACLSLSTPGDPGRPASPPEQLAAAYVIAADGARSSVRQSLGIAMEGPRSETAFIVVDLDELPDAPTPLERIFHYRHPAVGGRNVLLVPFNDGWRIDLQTKPGDDVQALQSADGVRRWVSSLMDPRYADRIAWISTYRFNQAVAEEYTDPQARVLLAGEAAHLFPPFGGGRGLNSGIADAVFAARAIGRAIRAGDPVCARSIISACADDRRRAGQGNRAAAAQALYRMEARSMFSRARQRAAAVLAPHSQRVGRWLDRGPIGPSKPLSAVSRF